jgi:hypothetical protein
MTFPAGKKKVSIQSANAKNHFFLVLITHVQYDVFLIGNVFVCLYITALIS